MDRSLALVISCLAACSFTPGKIGDPKVIDAAMIDMMPDASTCLAKSDECIADTLRQCSAAGATATDTVCGWGCDETGDGRCRTLTPAADGAMTADTLPMTGLADVMLVGGMTIDTAFGKIGSTPAAAESVRHLGMGLVDGITFEQRGNTAVFVMKSLHFVQGIGTPLNFVGTDAPILIADGEIVIDGIVDLHGGTCTSTIAGPGGFDGGLKNQPAQDFPNHGAGDAIVDNKLGGGGGGYGSVGGNGGNGVAPSTPTPAGGAVFGTPEIASLDGGGGGGGGGGNGGPGGGGGGAIQLISNTRIRILTGGINAGGCGGRSGNAGNDAGGGGGAGGAILLEAPIIEIDGALAVNGGGGGAGASSGTVYAEAGRLDRSPAIGVAAGASGGNGAAGPAGATNGATTGGKGGGGGGGFGRIRINTRTDTGLTLSNNAVLSPNFTDTATTCTRSGAVVQ